MINYASILSGALLDYTEWLLRQKGKMAGSPNELRGILYNKLISRLREVHGFPDLRNAITPLDMIVIFSPPGYIESLNFGKATNPFYNSKKREILDGLEVALLDVDVKNYRDKFAYDLSKVILDLKKDLSYGRKQSTTS